MELNSIEYRNKELQRYINKKNVTAFTGKFGIGKTTFINAFMEKTKDKNIFISFNANEFDYSENPKYVFINDLIKSIWKISDKGPAAKKIFRELLIKAQSIVMNKVKSEIDWSNENLFENIINDDETFSDKLKNLKKLISSLAERVDGDKNIVLVIDDLDRARPDFSIEVFEILKHLFDVDDISIIIVYNSKSMEDIARAKYGVSSGEGYFMKYIDNEYVHYEFSVQNMIDIFETSEKGQWLAESDIYIDSFRHFLIEESPTIREFEKKLKSKKAGEIILAFDSRKRTYYWQSNNIYHDVVFGALLYLYLFDPQNLWYSKDEDIYGKITYSYSPGIEKAFKHALRSNPPFGSHEVKNSRLAALERSIAGEDSVISKLVDFFWT